MGTYHSFIMYLFVVYFDQPLGVVPPNAGWQRWFTTKHHQPALGSRLPNAKNQAFCTFLPLFSIKFINFNEVLAFWGGFNWFWLAFRVALPTMLVDIHNIYHRCLITFFKGYPKLACSWPNQMNIQPLCFLIFRGWRA